MIINIGSKNPLKINAVKNAFSNYFEDVSISSIEVDSGVHHTPMSAEDAISGAKNRAKQVFRDCDYSVGIEGTFIRFPTKTNYMLSSVAVIYDGDQFYIGGSPLLDLPEKIIRQVLDGKELGTVFDEMTGIKNHKQKRGAAGFLTKGVIPREKALEIAVIYALAPILNKELYEDES